MTRHLVPMRYPLADPDHHRGMIEALSAWAPVTVEDGPEVERVYYDTFDWRIYRAGGTIEGTREGWIWRDGDGRVSFPRTPGRPPAFAGNLEEGELRSSLELIIQMRRLLPRVRVRSSSRVLRILDDEEKTVVRVSFVTGTVSLPDSKDNQPLPGRLHLLPVRGYGDAFSAVTSFLESRFPLAADDVTELEAALAAVGRKPADYTSKVALDLEPDLDAADAARIIHRNLLATMMRNEEGVRADTDSEFLHDFRVSIRRTRSALTQIKGVFLETDVARFRSGFKGLQTATGPTRDLDVWLLNLGGYRESLPPTTRPHLDALEAFIRKEQKRAHRKLVRALNRDEYATLIDDWKRFLGRSTPEEDVPANARRPVIEVASERIRSVFKRVLQRGRKIDTDTPAEELHQLRIDGKKLRYLLEFFRSLYDTDGITPLIKSLKQLQDRLGSFCDFEIQHTSLREFATLMTKSGQAPAETLMAMGRLAERLERNQAREREQFQECFLRFATDCDSKHMVRLFAEPRRGVGS